MLGFLKNIGGAAVGAATKEINAAYSGNKDFLEAVVAVAALVSYADGELEDSERDAAISVITGHGELGKIYDRALIEQTIDTMFKRAKSYSGRIQLERELEDIKGRPNGVQMAEDAFAVGLDIAHADGGVEPAEQEVLKKIGAKLGIDINKFA